MRGEPRDQELHPELRGAYWRELLLSLLVFVLPGLFVVARVAARRPGKPHELLAAAVELFVALVLIAAGLLLLRSAAWYRRCSVVLRQPAASRMHARFLRNQQGGLFVELRREGAGEAEGDVRLQLRPPSWDMRGLEHAIVDVHRDEDPKGPWVLETESGILWPEPLARRQNRARGRLE